MTKKKKKKKFPQNYRNIPATSKEAVKRFFLFIVVTGLVFLILVNLWSAISQPVYLKRLMQNPRDVEALILVLKQTNQPRLEGFIKHYLQSLDKVDLVFKSEKEKQEHLKNIIRIEEVLKQTPKYPDGYVYLALLYWENRECDKALKLIDQAIKLDPTRSKFKQVKKFIEKCE